MWLQAILPKCPNGPGEQMHVQTGLPDSGEEEVAFSKRQKKRRAGQERIDTITSNASRKTYFSMDEAHVQDPFDLSRIISQGWRLYRLNFLAIASVVLLVSLPVNAALSIIPRFFISGQGAYDAWITRLLSAAKLLMFNGLIAMAVARIIDASLKGAAIEGRAALRHALSRWGSALSLGPILGLFTIGLLLLMLVPRLGEAACYAFFVFYFLAVSLRNRSGMEAIDYSRALFRKQFGQVFWCLLVFFLFSAVFTAGMLPMLLVFPRIPAVAIGFNAILDLFLAYPFTMSTLFFLELDALQNENGARLD